MGLCSRGNGVRWCSLKRFLTTIITQIAARVQTPAAHKAVATAPHVYLATVSFLADSPCFGVRGVFAVRTVCGPEQAREYYEESLAAIRSPGQSNANGNGGGHSHVHSGDEELTSLFLVATAVVPALYESNDHIAQVCAYDEQHYVIMGRLFRL